MNKVIAIGNLGKPAETKRVGETSVTSFSLAVKETWKDKGGQRQERTEWINCVYWGKGGEAVSQYLEKGKQVCVEGKLQTRSWEKDGVKQYRTEVNVERLQLLGGKGGGGPRQQTGQDDGGAGEYQPGADDDIPF